MTILTLYDQWEGRQPVRVTNSTDQELMISIDGKQVTISPQSTAMFEETCDAE